MAVERGKGWEDKESVCVRACVWGKRSQQGKKKSRDSVTVFGDARVQGDLPDRRAFFVSSFFVLARKHIARTKKKL